MDASPKVSVIFITYNRIATLSSTVSAFLEHTHYPRNQLELIIADDGSPPSILREMERLPVDKIITSPKTRSGLGANVNRGISAATSDYLLQLQDDWICQGPRDYLVEALSVIREATDIGMLLLNQHGGHSQIAYSEQGPRFTVRRHRHDPLKVSRNAGDYAYSDWPHLKTRDFTRAIGPYLESLKMWDTELDYCRRVNSQADYLVADIEGSQIFVHIGEELSFNRPMKKVLNSYIMQFAIGRIALRHYRSLKPRK